MAGGKETPRQKMIGLMYLVLTAMLALNVSKQILQGYLSVNESLEKSKKNLTESNKRIKDAFEATVNGNPASKPYYDEALIAIKEIEKEYKYLDEIKGELARYTVELDESLKGKVNGDTIRLRREPWFSKIDDYDKPTTLLLGSDELNIKKGPLTADELRTHLNALHDKLIKQVEGMQTKTDANGKVVTKLPKDEFENLKKKIAIVKPTDSGREEDGFKYTWPMDNFYHLPFAAVFVNLNKMQADLKNVEAEILQTFSGASGKLAIKFDKIKARVIAPSSYIQQGDQYTANIFIGASSSSIRPEDMEVLIGVDSAAAAGGASGTKVEIVDGEGVYKSTGGSIGEQTYKGVIKYKDPEGNFKYYPFEQTYKVAPPAAAVSADKMQVFYRGVENPITVSAAGIAPADLVVSSTGGGANFRQDKPGHYIGTFGSTGDCMITVSAKTKTGSKPQGPPIKFTVLPLPKPELKIAGVFSPSSLPKSSLSNVAALVAGSNGFNFQDNYITQSWEVSGLVKGKYTEATGTGPNLSPQASAIFKGADPGSKISISASIMDPAKVITTIPCIIKVNR